MKGFCKLIIVIFLGVVYTQDVIITITEVTETTVELYMENSANVGGFQLIIADEPDAVTVTGAGGGLSTEYGFMLSTNESGLVLGFSLTGSYITPGAGVLAVADLAATGNFDYAQLDLQNLIFSDNFGNALDVEYQPPLPLGYAEWGTPPVEEVMHLTISDGIGEANTSVTLEASLENTLEVDGFQFVLSDTPDLISLVSAETTERTSDFTLSTEENGLVLGFSLTEGVIDPGEGPIAVLTFDVGMVNGIADLEFSDIIITDALGNEIESTSTGGTFTVTGGMEPPPSVTILEPEDGALIYGQEIEVSVQSTNLIDDDHYHAYIDNTLQGMYYTDSFTLTGVEYGIHELRVTVADGDHNNYENPEAADTLSFENVELPLEGYTLSIGNGVVNVGESGDVDISLSNEGVVGGFQLAVVDFPDYADVISVDVTDRTENFQVAFNEQEDGSVSIVGFDLTLEGVAPGNGPILTLSYVSTTNWQTDLDLYFDMAFSLISDLVGIPLEFESENGILTLNGDPHPGVLPPENLSAVGGWQTVSLSWDHPEPWDVTGYYILRDGINVGESNITNYTDSGLDTGVEYCYTIMAFNDFMTSEESEQVCATTSTEFSEPPRNLNAAENGLQIFLNWQMPQQPHPQVQGFEVYRDNVMLDFVQALNYLDDNDLWYLETYCYNVTAVYSEGTSGFSNTACATPQLGAPDQLSARGEGDHIHLSWEAHPDNAQDSFYIYREGTLLDVTTDTEYDDADTEHDVEYCYTVTAYYEGIGESPATEDACGMWRLCPPSYVAAEPHVESVNLTWDETSCGEEVYLQYSEGPLNNAFYFYDTYWNGYAHGVRFDVGTDFDVLAASVYILIEGDLYWPWPNATHGPVSILVFDDNGGIPGNLLFEDEAVVDETGYATVYPNLTGLSGAFHVVGTHQENWSFGGDPEGFGLDNGVNYPQNMVTCQAGNWSVGDALGYGGDYMMAAMVNAYGQIQPMTYADLPVDPVLDETLFSVTPADEAVSSGTTPHPVYFPNPDRELLGYDIYRDGEHQITVDPDVFDFLDDDLVNLTEYCYTMTANYTEGESEPTEPVCAMPIPGYPPTALTATDMGGTIFLEWMMPVMFEDPLLDFQVYRDGELLGVATEPGYEDPDPEPSIEYCYTVTARYDTGESLPSNEACSMYLLNPPLGVLAEGDNENLGIQVTWFVGGEPPEGDTIDDAIIVTGVPYETEGTTIGLNDDYDEVCPYSGSTSPDAVYMWFAFPGVYNIDICDSDYDTKLYVYNENQVNLGCVDDSCYSPNGDYYRSNLNISIPDSGVYYIVIDGYGGQSGNYHLLIENGALEPDVFEPQPPKEISDNIIMEVHEFSRDLIGYNVYRNEELIAAVDTETTQYFDDTAAPGIVYCYTVTSLYDEGESLPANDACAQWLLPSPFGLTAGAVGSDIEVSWNGILFDGQYHYDLYRDSTYLVTLEPETLMYLDGEVEHDVLYCYHVQAVFPEYETFTVSNEDCAMWMLLPPGFIFAEPGDQTVMLQWTLPASGLPCADETIQQLPYNFVGSTTGMEDSWDVAGEDGPDAAHGLVVTETMNIRMTTCSGITNFNTMLEIFTADGDCVGTSTGYYNNNDEQCPFGPGFSSLNNVTLEPGIYYVVVDGDAGDFGTYQLRIQEIPGALGDDDGEWADIDPVEETDTGSNEMLRDLTGYTIYRDGEILESVALDILNYEDTGLTNLQEYCYTITADYDEGSSPQSPEVCAVPIPGEAPVNLTISPGEDHLLLTWEGAPDALEYVVYRNGTEIDRTTNTEYQDNAEPGVEHCYWITGQYTNGESLPSNTVCGQWNLGSVYAWIENQGCDSIELAWTLMPPGGLCGDEVIMGLPFEGTGTNVGMGNDWDVQGSDGADYAYGITLAEQTLLRVTLCTPLTNFDTKLEIFTANEDCQGQTTGYYNDDSNCPINGLYSTINNALLQPGEYYIVVDGYGGHTGNFGIFIEETEFIPNDCNAEAPYPPDDPCYLWVIEIDPYCCDTSWDDLCEEEYWECMLDGGQPTAGSAEDIYQRFLPEALAAESAKSGVMIQPEDWSHAPPARNRSLLGFNISRDGIPLASVGPDDFSFTDTDLTMGVEYCYAVIAEFDEGLSNPSVEACAEPSGEFYCIPENFQLEITGGLPFADLSWSMPPECGEDGFLLYRDDELIADLPAGTTNYQDAEMFYGIEHCWYLQATYGNCESYPTEILCGTVIEIENFTYLSIDDGVIEPDQEITLGINLNNPFDVAGFQFTLTPYPHYVDVTDVAATPRLDNFSINWNTMPDGSLIVVAFSLTGDIITVGEGAILEVDFTTTPDFAMGDIILDFSDYYFGDINGSPLMSYAQDGVIVGLPGPVTTLHMDDVHMTMDQSGWMDISLNNLQEISGFQFMLEMDNPIAMTDSITTTARTEGWMLGFNDGMIVGFTLTGEPLPVGDGPVVSAFEIPMAEGEANVCFNEIIISDPEGNPVTAMGECAVMIITEGGGEVTQEVVLQPYMNNLISFNAAGDDMSVESLFGANVFVAWNDDGQYYVPTYSIDQIEEVSVSEGYTVFPNSDSPVTLSVTGQAADPGTVLEIQPFMNNQISYIPQEPMTTQEAFGAYGNDILIIKNDLGEYYVPSLSVETLTMLVPGKGYEIFLDRTEVLNYVYPAAGLAKGPNTNLWESLKEAGQPVVHQVTRTGISHPIIITDISGFVEPGDELLAYAGDLLVGAVRIADLTQPVVLSAWAAYREFGLDLPGYHADCDIELRLWSMRENRELRVEADLNNDVYGLSPLSSGSAAVHRLDAVPTEFLLMQNYPNPFNPVTRIDFAVPNPGTVSLKIYDITGRLVKTLASENLGEGYHQVLWNGTDGRGRPVAAGVYIYTLTGAGFSESRKMVLMK